MAGSQKITGRFHRFLLASAGLHAALLLLASPDMRSLPGHRETLLSIHLIGLEQSAPPSAVVKSPRRAAATAATPARVARAVVTAATPARTDSNVPDTGAASTAAETLRAQVESRLLAQLDPYFKKHYPRLALRYGWQGKVLLAFTVMPDGELERIQVAQSSGYDVLDRAAVSSLQRFGNGADLARWLNGKALDIKLPVIYRLTDH